MIALALLVAMHPLLDEAQAHLDAGDPAAAIAALQSVPEPLSLDDYARRDELFGISYASMENDVDAEQHFARLLVVKPDHSLSYTRSPKVAFPYERARKARRSDAALQVRTQAPLVLAWDEPITLDVVVTGNPLDLLQKLEVCRRMKQSDDKVCVTPAPGQVSLDAIAPPAPDANGLALIETRGFDANGNEIYRSAPVEIPIGFAPPPPWYTSAWLWGGVAAGVAISATAATLIAINTFRARDAGFSPPVVLK